MNFPVQIRLNIEVGENPAMRYIYNISIIMSALRAYLVNPEGVIYL